MQHVEQQATWATVQLEPAEITVLAATILIRAVIGRQITTFSARQCAQTLSACQSLGRST